MAQQLEMAPIGQLDEQTCHCWWCPYFVHHFNCSYVYNNANNANNGHGINENALQTMPSKESNQMLRSDTSVEKHMKSKEKHISKKPLIGSNEFETERLYSCRLCHELSETKDQSVIRKHIEKHLGFVRPFICQVCHKVFKFRSICRNHLIAHSVVRKHVQRIDY